MIRLERVGSARLLDALRQMVAALDSLAPRHRVIVETVLSTPGLSCREIAAAVYADRPDGGPLTACREVNCAIASFNRLNAPLRIVKRCGGYHLTGAG